MRLRTVVLTVLAVGLLAFPVVAQTISSGTNQIFNVGSPDRVANPITIADAAGTITTATGIRIIIPTGLNLQWSDTVTTLDVSGSAAGKINTTPVYSFNRDTLTIDVTADWAADDQVVINNLVFTNFSATNSGQRLRLDAGAVSNARDNRTIRVLAALVSIESQEDQSFIAGDVATPISPITITEAGANTQIKAGRDIRVRIPSGLAMNWDTTITTAVIGGPDANRVSPIVTYENGGKVLVINVIANFTADDWITIAGLKFADFTAASGPGFLELVLDPIANTADAIDDASKTILPKIFGTAVSPHADTVSRLPSNGTNYTVDFTVSNTGNGTGFTSYVLLTTRRPGGLPTISLTGTGVTQGSNPDSAEVATVPAGGSRVVTVTYSVDNGADGSVDTLVFRARAIGGLATTDSGLHVVTLVKPVLTVVKSVSPSGTATPGTDLTYTTTLENAGKEKAASVAHVDSVPAQLGFKVGSASTTVPAGITATVAYSNDGGATWTYVPVSAGCGAPAGYDSCVRALRVTLGNSQALKPHDSVQLRYVAKVK